MSVKVWRGDAQPVRNVWTVTLDGVTEVTLTINRKAIVGTTGTEFAAAILASTIPEWQEVEATGGTASLVLTGPEDGTPIEVSCTTDAAIVVTTTVPGAADTNEKQTVSIVGATGGTFTLSFGGYTTGNIAFNADAATVETAFEALTSVGSGNGTVSGTAGAWVIEFTGTLAHTDVALVTGSGANLTPGASATISTVTQGTNSANPRFRLNPGTSGGFALEGYLPPPRNTNGLLSPDFSQNSLSPNVIPGYLPYNCTAQNILDHLDAVLGTPSNVTSDIYLFWGNPVHAYATVVADPDYAGQFLIEFKGSIFEGQTMPGIGMYTNYNNNGSYGTGIGCSCTAITTGGSEGDNEVQKIILGIAQSGTWTISYAGQTTAALGLAATADDVEAALEALSNIGTGNIAVTKTETVSTSTYYLTFQGDLAGTNVAEVTATTTGLGGRVVGVSVTQASAVNTNEVQTVTIDNITPSGGTFTLSYGGQTTSALAYNASAAAVQAALIALSSVGPTDVAVTGTTLGTWVVTFQNSLGNQDVAKITGVATSIVGDMAEETTLSSGPHHFSEPKNWDANAIPVDGDTIVFQSGSSDCLYDLIAYQPVHYIDIATANGGTFSLTFDGCTTGALAYSVSAADMQTALGGLASIGSGKVTVTSGSTGLYTITLSDTAAENPKLHLTGDGTNLTGDTLTITHGLLSPAAVKVYSSYTGKIGLANQNDLGYYEYRPRVLTICDTHDAQAVTIEIGLGEGSGSGRIRLNTGAVQTTLTVYDTGSASDYPFPAVQWQGTHASNAARVYKGSVGIGVGSGETTVVSTLDVGHASSQDSDSEVSCGQAVTMGTVVKSGGTLLLDSRSGSAITAITQHAGTMTIDGTDGVTQLTILGGTVYYNTSGTLAGAPKVSGDGVLDFSRDMRAKTVTNPIEIYGEESHINDPYKVVSSLVADWNETTRYAGLGRNVRITRGTPS